MTSKFPEYRYGGNKSDYEIAYRDVNSGKIYRTLVNARKGAINSEYAYMKYNPTRDTWGNIDTRKYAVCYIEAMNFYKFNNGTSITYRQQSGRTKRIGFVAIENSEKTNNRDVIFWIDTVKKSDSRVINKDGVVIRKLTAEEKRRF